MIHSTVTLFNILHLTNVPYILNNGRLWKVYSRSVWLCLCFGQALEKSQIPEPWACLDLEACLKLKAPQSGSAHPDYRNSENWPNSTNSPRRAGLRLGIGQAPPKLLLARQGVAGRRPSARHHSSKPTSLRPSTRVTMSAPPLKQTNRTISRCPAIQQQKLLCTPGFGKLKAHLHARLLLRSPLRRRRHGVDLAHLCGTTRLVPPGPAPPQENGRCS